jgi:ribosome maturation factor RimP
LKGEWIKPLSFVSIKYKAKDDFMAKKKIEETIEELVLPITNELNYELVDVEFVKEGANWYLRVYIDKEGGIMIEDCTAVSQRLSDILDEVDPITNSYILEVSSPGLTRPIKKDKDFQRNKGNEIEINLFKALDGKKSYEGVLEGIDENRNVVLVLKNGEKTIIDRELISLAKLKLDF